MSRWPVAGLVLLAAGFPGCASYRPKPLDPVAELAVAAHREQELVRVQVLAPEGARPVTLDDGLDEVEAVAIALTLNPSLRAQRLAQGEADAALITAGLWPNPTLGVGVRDGRAGVLVDSDLLFGLLRPGERAAKRELAQAQQAATHAVIIAAEWDLVADVRRARLAVLTAALVSMAIGEEVSLRERALTLVRRQEELGEARELDVATATWELGDARHEQRQAEGELDQARRELDRLLGLPADYDVQLTGIGEPLALTEAILPADSDIDACVAQRRSDLTRLEAEYHESEQELRLAVAKQYPQLSLGPSLSRDKDATSLGLAASIELPIFDRNQGGIKAADAKREQSRAIYQAALHDLLSRAHAARASAERTDRDVQEYRAEVIPAAERASAMLDQGLASHDVSVLEYLVQRRRLVETRLGFLRAVSAHQRARIDLDAAMGRSPIPPAVPDSAPQGPTP